jgi:uncharacterized tellurite resistance protein B-like protein
MAISDLVFRGLVKRALTNGGPVSKADARLAIEIACLAVASDGKLANEELAALRALNAELNAFANAELEGLIGKSLALHSREDRLDRLQATANALSTEGARHLAYQLSVVTALADLATADEEFEFDLDVQDALKLDSELAERLSGEVNEALMLPE